MSSYVEYASDIAAEEYRPHESASMWRDESLKPIHVASTEYRRVKRLKLIAPASKRARASKPIKEGALEKDFKRLVSEWRAETAFLSDPTSIILHPAYQRIIGLGRIAVPLVIAELMSSGGDWFWALRFMTGADPVKPSTWGDFDSMKAAWVSWWTTHQSAYV